MKQFTHLAGLALTSVAHEMRYVDTEPNRPRYLDVKNNDDEILATGSVRYTGGPYTVDGRLRKEFNIIFNVELADGLEFQEDDRAELWYCLEIVFARPQLDYKWDEEKDGPAPSYHACHVSKFTYTSELTAEIEYDHYYTPFAPEINQEERPSEQFARWEAEVWPTWAEEF